MRYQHKKTGAVIDVPVSIKGEFWEAIEEDASDERPKARRTKQAAKEG